MIEHSSVHEPKNAHLPPCSMFHPQRRGFEPHLLFFNITTSCRSQSQWLEPFSYEFA